MGKTERQGRKWAVEEYEGDSSIKVTAENQTQSVYIYKCKDSVVQIEGKVRCRRPPGPRDAGAASVRRTCARTAPILTFPCPAA